MTGRHKDALVVILASVTICVGIILICAAVASAQDCHYRMDGNVYLPDKKCTPGTVDPMLAALNHKTGLPKVCDADFRTGQYRSVSAAMHKQIYAEYGVEPGKGTCAGGCEDDHLISLTDGGSNLNANRWPQPSKGIGFHVKDIMEAHLHRMVCAKKITLKQADDCLADDWYSCGVKMGIIDRQGHYLLGKR